MSALSPKLKPYSHSSLMRYARMLGFGDIHHRIDPVTGLNSIIAIHNIKLGPAIGGCRFYAYDSYNQALLDVIRLANMMTLKNAACGLRHGGAKAVIIKPKHHIDREALFGAFGDFVNDMNGDYIAAPDINTTTSDMNCIAQRTPHVIGATESSGLQEDPSPYTATGVLRGIEAAVKFKLKKDSLEGVTVAIQGAGKVGYNLAKYLHKQGTNIIASDIKAESTDRLADEFNATIVDPNEINQVNCDVLSPCAMGGSITAKSVSKLKAKIIAGSANNQLSHHSVADMLNDSGILYVPDFMAGSGGVIHAASIHDYHDVNIANKKIDELYDRLYEVFERAHIHKCSTDKIAIKIAYENLNNLNQH